MSAIGTVALVGLLLGLIGVAGGVWYLARELTPLADAVADLSVRLVAANRRTLALEEQLEGLTDTVAHLAQRIDTDLDDQEDTPA